MNKHQKYLYTICSTVYIAKQNTFSYIGTSITFKAGIINFANVLNKKKYDSENYFYCEKN